MTKACVVRLSYNRYRGGKLRNVALKGDREKQIALSVNTIADARIGAEGQEGMDALLSKRSPTWVQS